jgi:hypothetical protein
MYSLITTGKGLAARGQQQINQTLAYASGDYYTGQVDKKATIPNKIDIKDFKATQPKFRDIDPISVFATLTTETIDITPPPVATITCSATNGGLQSAIRSFTSTPEPSQVTLLPYDSWDLTCSFKEGTFKFPPTKQATINLTAQFDFMTQAYLKTYWMDQARLQELRTSQKDPLTVYSVPDKNPITIYTNGPLKTGMRISSQSVQGLDRNSETTLTLGVTFDNAWEGTVVKLSSIVVFVPKGMRVVGVVGQAAPPKQINCNDDAIAAADKDSCDDLLDNIYYLEPQNVDLSKFLTLLFTVKIGPADYNNVLSLSPITARFFKTTVRYTYAVTRILSVPIESTALAVVQTGTVETTPAQIVGTPSVSTAPTTAVITYATNQPTKDKITFYAADGVQFIDAYEDDYASKNETPSHTVHLSALMPVTKYNYKITSVNVNNIKALNQEAGYTFTTGAAS